MNPIEKLKSVLCNPDGKASIAGSSEDLRIIDEALLECAEQLEAAIQERDKAILQECGAIQKLKSQLSSALEREKIMREALETFLKKHEPACKSGMLHCEGCIVLNALIRVDKING